MVNNQFRKIYQISSLNNDKIYIGSTRQKYLCNRLAQHKKQATINDVTHCKSKLIMDSGDAIITLLETFPCQNIEELRAREAEWIAENTNICVNVNSANGEDPEKVNKRLERFYVARKAKVKCICGVEVQKRQLQYHMKSKAHITSL